LRGLRVTEFTVFFWALDGPLALLLTLCSPPAAVGTPHAPVEWRRTWFDTADRREKKSGLSSLKTFLCSGLDLPTMAMAPPRSLAVALLLLAAAAAIPSTTCDRKNEELEDLQYLTDNAGDVPANDSDEWLQEEGFPDDDEDGDDFLHESEAQDQIDETHVVVLTAFNFSTFLASHRHVMVEFYAPWCGHCQALAPDYAAAAAHLASHHNQDNLALVKVDATEDTDLAQKYDVQGFPTIFFFIDGVPKDYTGARTKDAIITWIDKKLGPGVHNLSDLDQAERILTGDDKAVLAFLDTLSVRATTSSLPICPLLPLCCCLFLCCTMRMLLGISHIELFFTLIISISHRNLLHIISCS
jgi:protein disulfide-isomerase-like protein